MMWENSTTTTIAEVQTCYLTENLLGWHRLVIDMNCEPHPLLLPLTFLLLSACTVLKPSMLTLESGILSCSHFSVRQMRPVSVKILTRAKFFHLYVHWPHIAHNKRQEMRLKTSHLSMHILHIVNHCYYAKQQSDFSPLIRLIKED